MASIDNDHDEKVLTLFNDAIKELESLIDSNFSNQACSIMQIELASLLEKLKKKSLITEYNNSHHNEKFYEETVPPRSLSPTYNPPPKSLSENKNVSNATIETTNDELTLEEEISINAELAWAIQQSKKETSAVNQQQKMEKKMEDFNRNNPNAKLLPLEEYNSLLQAWMLGDQA